MAFKFFSLLFGVRVDGDGVDRLTSLYSFALFLTLSLLTALLQLIAKPISCVSMQSYAESICWRQKTYLPLSDDNLPDEPSAQVSIFTYVPVLMLLQAMLVFLPCIPWRVISEWTDLKVASILEAARKSGAAKHPEERLKMVTFMAGAISGSKGSMSVIVLSFMATKVFYFLILAIHLILLDFLLAPENRLYGIRVVYNLLRNNESPSSPIFPRAIQCQFAWREHGSIYRKSVQCTPLFNDFYEMLFGMIWCWVLILLITTTVNGIFWVMKLVNRSGNINYVRNLLECSGCHKNQLSNIEQIYHSSIGAEGILLLRLIASNVGATEASDVVHEIWSRGSMQCPPGGTQERYPAHEVTPSCPSETNYPGVDQGGHPMGTSGVSTENPTPGLHHSKSTAGNQGELGQKSPETTGLLYPSV